MPEENVVPPVNVTPEPPTPVANISTPTTKGPEHPMSRKFPSWLVWLLIVLVLIILGAGGYWLLAGKTSDQSFSKTAVTSTPTSTKTLVSQGSKLVLNNLGNELNKVFSNKATLSGGNIEVKGKPFKLYQYWGKGINKVLLEDVYDISFENKTASNAQALDQARNTINFFLTQTDLLKMFKRVRTLMV